MDEDKCENCRFFLKSETVNSGWCRRRAPQGSSRVGEWFYFPCLNVNSWCGEHERVKKKPSKKAKPTEVTLPPHLDTVQGREALATWLSYKSEKGSAYKPRGLKSFVTKIGNEYKTPMALAAAVEHSASNNYSGLFPKKEHAKAATTDDILDRSLRELQGKEDDNGTDSEVFEADFSHLDKL